MGGNLDRKDILGQRGNDGKVTVLAREKALD